MHAGCSSPLKVLFVIAAIALASCGGGGGESSSPTPLYAVAGVVAGLSGTGLVLRNNGGDDLAIAGNGSFTFATRIASGGAYSITVQAQPADSTLNCVVMNAGRAGIVQGADVTAIAVECHKIARIAYVGYYDPVSKLPVSVALAIDPTSGALTQPAQSPTPFGTAIVTPPLSGNVYGYASTTLAGGVSGIAGFGIDPASGAVRALPGSPYGVGIVPASPTCNPPGYCDSAVEVSLLALDPSGSQCLYGYYVQWGPPAPSIPLVSTIVAFQIDQGTGALTVASNPAGTGGYSTVAMQADPAGRYLYSVESPNIHIATQGGIHRFLIDGSTCALSDSGIDTVVDSFFRSLSFEPRGVYAYVVGSAAGAVQTLAVDSLSGALRQIGSLVAAPGISALTVDAVGAFAYGSCTGGICAFSLDAVGGLPTALPGSPFSAGMSSSSVVPDPGGKFLLSICGTDVCVYSTDPVTGIPSLRPGSPFQIAGVAPLWLALVAG